MTKTVFAPIYASTHASYSNPQCTIPHDPRLAPLFAITSLLNHGTTLLAHQPPSSIAQSPQSGTLLTSFTGTPLPFFTPPRITSERLQTIATKCTSSPDSPYAPPYLKCCLYKSSNFLKFSSTFLKSVSAGAGPSFPGPVPLAPVRACCFYPSVSKFFEVLSLEDMENLPSEFQYQQNSA
jgi:hypothetical protein